MNLSWLYMYGTGCMSLSITQTVFRFPWGFKLSGFHCTYIAHILLMSQGTSHICTFMRVRSHVSFWRCLWFPLSEWIYDLILPTQPKVTRDQIRLWHWELCTPLLSNNVVGSLTSHCSRYTKVKETRRMAQCPCPCNQMMQSSEWRQGSLCPAAGMMLPIKTLVGARAGIWICNLPRWRQVGTQPTD